MRLSSYPNHPDYKREWLPAYVFLDGEYVRGCTHVDTELGQVAFHARDRRGELMVDEGGYLVTHIRRGKVTLRRNWKDAEAMGFDAWMRARTEARHQEFMKRTSA